MTFEGHWSPFDIPRFSRYLPGVPDFLNIPRHPLDIPNVLFSFLWFLMVFECSKKIIFQSLFFSVCLFFTFYFFHFFHFFHFFFIFFCYLYGLGNFDAKFVSRDLILWELVGKMIHQICTCPANLSVRSCPVKKLSRALPPCISSSDGPVRRKLFSMRRVAPDKVFYCG